MRYAHILLAIAGEVWAMEPDKLATVIEFLAVQASGVKFDAEEIEARISPQTAAAVARREGAIQILPIRGIIANRAPMVSASTGPGFNLDSFNAAFDQAADNSDVKTIVLDVDCPGGNVMGVDETARRIFDARGRKPIIAQVNALNASAAYWITSAADEIVATPSSQIGAIGVRMVYEDVAKKLEMEGVSPDIIFAGKYKGEGIVGPLGEDTRAHLQAKVDEYYGMFVERVAKGRGVAASAVRDGFGEGRTISAKRALEAGMIDRIATMQETLARFGVQPRQSAASGAGARQRRERALALATI